MLFSRKWYEYDRSIEKFGYQFWGCVNRTINMFED